MSASVTLIFPPLHAYYTHEHKWPSASGGLLVAVMGQSQDLVVTFTGNELVSMNLAITFTL